LPFVAGALFACVPDDVAVDKVVVEDAEVALEVEDDFAVEPGLALVWGPVSVDFGEVVDEEVAEGLVALVYGCSCITVILVSESSQVIPAPL
jgi:hypothetical protein